MSCQAAFVEDDSMFDENGEIIETGYMDEKGEMRRPWCAATRILEHRENVRGEEDVWMGCMLGAACPRCVGLRWACPKKLWRWQMA